MALTEAKCTNCSAALTVDAAQDAAVCKFCGAAFIVEKAIAYHTNHIKADVINVFNSDSFNADKLADDGEALFALQDFNAAAAKFRKLTTEHPRDYRGWWGLARLLPLKEMIYETVKHGVGINMPEEFSRAIHFAPDNEKHLITEHFNKYREQYFAEAASAIQQFRAAAQIAFSAYRQAYNENKVLTKKRNLLWDAERRVENAHLTYKRRDIKLFSHLLIAIVIGCISFLFFPTGFVVAAGLLALFVLRFLLYMRRIIKLHSIPKKRAVLDHRMQEINLYGVRNEYVQLCNKCGVTPTELQD